jgi:hypothetical protein
MRFKALSVMKGVERWKVLEFASLQNYRPHHSANEYCVTAVLVLLFFSLYQKQQRIYGCKGAAGGGHRASSQHACSLQRRT